MARRHAGSATRLNDRAARVCTGVVGLLSPTLRAVRRPGHNK